MEILMQAGQMSAQLVDTSLPVEDQAHFHSFRISLVEAFTSIINGIKSQGEAESDQARRQYGGQVSEAIQNMFYYLEGILSLQDLQVNEEFGKQLMDLYCDLVDMQASDDLLLKIKQSQVPQMIKQSLRGVMGAIHQSDNYFNVRRNAADSN